MSQSQGALPGCEPGAFAESERGTPLDLFGVLDAEFGFEADVCALDSNTKVPSLYFTPEEDGLIQDWAPRKCWMNPPYAHRELFQWCWKAVREARRGALVVGLLPAFTDSEWFHRWVVPHAAEIRFLSYRVRFLAGRSRLGRPRFSSMLAVWKPSGPGRPRPAGLRACSCPFLEGLPEP